MSMPETGKHDTPTTSGQLSNRSNRWVMPVFLLVLLAGFSYVFYSLGISLEGVSAVPWILLTAALLLAFTFEFANGFHDTANAVATVIYTRSMAPQVAVLWSGLFNFAGALMASGAVAYGIIALLPVELITQAGSSTGLAMVFALLLSAIGWNLGTWAMGIPNSSSHTLIGSILGVGLANRFLESSASIASGIDWGQAEKIGLTLLISPLVGFIGAAVLLLVMKKLVRSKTLNERASEDSKPPLWIRSLLILTCTGVSFAHGSNDGQKGMGLIMLILVGLVPTAFALNQSGNATQMTSFRTATAQLEQMLEQHAPSLPEEVDHTEEVTEAIKQHRLTPLTPAALAEYLSAIRADTADYHSFADVPSDDVNQLRNNIYITGQALQLIEESSQVRLSDSDLQVAEQYHQAVKAATEYIPLWVKVAVALALGLGTMIGWKRVVVTVGEKIGRSGLDYGQGIAAQAVTMGTILFADKLGMPASTTHVLSSGVAGTMAAEGSGLQWGTIRNMILAWVLTLPATMILSFVLFIALGKLF
ncbi:inorganic phosphate transporter [Carnimonas nigrificans]|uniref:inorganic phosphate transporter n=1 Tax=Carnimonas nigrificans TaxID=64323 RepID=UPI00047183C3|nr:inorganic phosphate transporter [Carnimonas nigrificans]